MAISALESLISVSGTQSYAATKEDIGREKGWVRQLFHGGALP